MSASELITDHFDLWTCAVTAKSTAGRGPSSGKRGKIELTGIKKLRELILELAVRGKLVDQDPSDEPASVLLERIAEEKARRVKEGKIKKPKKLPEIDEDEAPFSIPHSWALARLGESVEIVRGITFPASEKSSIPEIGRVVCLRTSNVQDKIEWGDLLYIKDSFVSKNSQYVQKNDIVMSMANSRELVGKVAIIEKSPSEPTAFGGFLGVIRPILLHPRFIMAVLRAPHARIALIGSASQTTNIANISIGKLNPFVIGIPPIEEQHRIVEKVDELMALCDRLEQQVGDQLEAHEVLVDTLLGSLFKPAEGSLTRSTDATEVAENWARIAEHFDTLFTTEGSIDNLKQAILQLAVMGRLVAQDPDDEPASVLLERIAEEKVRLVREGKIKKPKIISTPHAEEIPFLVPKNWKWCRLESLTLHSESGWSPQCNNNPRSGDDWGVLKVSAVSWGLFNSDENKALPASLKPRPELEVKPNDFLISRANTAELVARSAVVPEGVPKHLMMSDKIVRFVFSAQVNVLYINLFNNSKVSRDYYSRVAGGTSSSMKNVSRKQVQDLLVPLPPEKEQHRIVDKVDELMALCDQLKASLGEAGETRTHLAEAVVEKAVL